ncbi:MAG: 50S ribosomal protein L11 methyltransferase [Actinobacteria bacterium]|nr:50S ribosomal protein L11 methyltransferase [Actinomycetota bacterium]
MEDFLYSVSAILPRKLEPIFELISLDFPYSLETINESIKVTTYSSESFEEAETYLKKIVELLTKDADLLNVDFFEREQINFYREKLNKDKYYNEYKKYLKPIKVLDKIIIVPNSSLGEEFDDFRIPVVFLSSLLAFGTGSHPTTRMCLEYLAEQNLKNKIVVDAGTGSGILAIAAAKLGAKRVVAFDKDQVAVSVARSNVKLNGVDDIVEVIEGELDLLESLKADILVANLTSEIILDNFSILANASVNRIGLSGFLKADEQEIIDRFSASLSEGIKKESSGWVFLEFRRV